MKMLLVAALAVLAAAEPAAAAAEPVVAEDVKPESAMLRVPWGLRNARWERPANASELDATLVSLKITRADVIARAESWVAAKTPYCQCNGPEECCGNCPHCGTFRCDCSGYVSYCWGLPYGYTTETLPQVSHRIAKDDLKPGDVLLNTADHVVIFGGWADAAHTEYLGYQEPGCHVDGPHYAFKSTITYPFGDDPSFVPYRYNGIQ